MLWLLPSSYVDRNRRSLHDHSVGELFRCNNTTCALDAWCTFWSQIALCTYLKRNETSPIIKTIHITLKMKLTHDMTGFLRISFKTCLRQSPWFGFVPLNKSLEQVSTTLKSGSRISIFALARPAATSKLFFSRLSFGCSVIHFNARIIFFAVGPWNCCQDTILKLVESLSPIRNLGMCHISSFRFSTFFVSGAQIRFNKHSSIMWWMEIEKKKEKKNEKKKKKKIGAARISLVRGGCWRFADGGNCGLAW